MSSRDHVGATRVRLGTDESGSGMYGAHRWADGLLLIDVFRPDRYRRLHLSGDELTTPLGVHVRQLHESGPVEPAAVELPKEWVRAAVVDAVDRWVDLRLEADLLLADRALAAAELQATSTAAALYARARRGLADLVDRLNGAYEKPQALLDELALVLRHAPDGYGVRAPRISSASSLSNPFDALAQEERRSRSRAVRYLGKGPGAADDDPAGGIRVLVHPLHVAARIFGGTPTATETQGRIEVVGPAAPGVTASTPAARRMLVSAVDVETLRVESVWPFALDGDTFRAAVRPIAVGSPSTLVVVHDAAAMPVLTLPPDIVERAATLAAARDAYSAERLAQAYGVLGDTTGEELARQSRLTSLMQAEPPPPAWVGLDAPWVAADRLKHAVRPLLAELALAHP